METIPSKTALRYPKFTQDSIKRAKFAHVQILKPKRVLNWTNRDFSMHFTWSRAAYRSRERVWLQIKGSLAGSSPGPSTYFRGDLSWNNFYDHSPPSADSRREDVSFWRKYVNLVLVNRLERLSLPRNSVVRLTDRLYMTEILLVRRKTTAQTNKLYMFCSELY